MQAANRKLHNKKEVNHHDINQYIDDYFPKPNRSLEKEKANVWKIFQITEAYFYYVNRYANELTKSFSPITKKIAKLQGLCYHQFSNDTDYLKAWMTAGIFEKILFPSETDTVVQFIRHENLHHDISFRKVKDDFIFRTFKKFQTLKKEDISSHHRLMTVLMFTGTSFYYDHQHKKLFKIIEDHNKNNPKDKINPITIKNYCDKIVKMKNKKDKLYKYTEYCYLTGQEIA